MDWQQLIIYAIEVIGTGLLSWLGTAAIKWLKTKTKNEKVIALAESVRTVTTNAVKATYQTYVQAIKGTDAWTEEAQLKALNDAIATAKTSMTTEAMAYLESQHGDINVYLGSLAESILYDLKNKFTESK